MRGFNIKLQLFSLFEEEIFERNEGRERLKQIHCAKDALPPSIAAVPTGPRIYASKPSMLNKISWSFSGLVMGNPIIS